MRKRLEDIFAWVLIIALFISPLNHGIRIFGVALGWLVIAIWVIWVLADGIFKGWREAAGRLVILVVLVLIFHFAKPGMIECSSPWVTDYDACMAYYGR